MLSWWLDYTNSKDLIIAITHILKYKKWYFSRNCKCKSGNELVLVIVIYHQNLLKVITLLSACASIINNSNVPYSLYVCVVFEANQIRQDLH